MMMMNPPQTCDRGDCVLPAACAERDRHGVLHFWCAWHITDEHKAIPLR